MNMDEQTEYHLWIGGEPKVRRVASDSRVPPATSAACGSVGDASDNDAVAAVVAAFRALEEGRMTAPRERAEISGRCFDLMIQRSEHLARPISAQNGKALADARAEITYGAEFFRWYSEEAVPHPGSDLYVSLRREQHRRPV